MSKALMEDLKAVINKHLGGKDEKALANLALTIVCTCKESEEILVAVAGNVAVLHQAMMEATNSNSALGEIVESVGLARMIAQSRLQAELDEMVNPSIH